MVTIICPHCGHTYQDEPDIDGFQTWRFCPECSSTIPPDPYTGIDDYDHEAGMYDPDMPHRH